MKARKKAVEVEFVTLLNNPTSIDQCVGFVGVANLEDSLKEAMETDTNYALQLIGIAGGIEINTVDGYKKIRFSDSVVKDAEGQFMPVPATIFKRDYEVVAA